MSNVTFNINMSGVVELTNKLEKLHRSALPVAIRQTLNDAAFETRIQALKEFDQQFIVRRPTFAKSHLRANKSQNTFDINKMESSMGIIEGKSKSGDNLELQETGGVIWGRSVPTSETRIGRVNKSRQSARYYYRKFRNTPRGHVPTQRGKRISARPKEQFIKTDKALLSVSRGGIWRTLYYIDKNVQIKKNAFIVPAGVNTSKKIHRLYANRAKQQFKRLVK